MTSGQSEANREFGKYDSDPGQQGGIYPQNDENERTYGGISERVKDLAKHKEPKIGWQTCVGPQVKWGTQELLWPVSARAMAGKASPRVVTLATPKRNFQKGTVHEGRPMFYYGVGRPSTIWSVSEGAKKGSSTERVQLLAQHKKYHPNWAEDKDQFYFSCGRESPIWKVQRGAMQCQERPHTTVLARHRDYPPGYQGERPIESKVSAAARIAIASDRITDMALPRVRPDGPFRDPQWPVSNPAKYSVASARCTELARYKPLVEGFQHARGVEWPVSKAAQNAQASPRVEELSRPVTRATMDHVQFNPNAFSVKESALKGIIPQRIGELAQPVKR